MSLVMLKDCIESKPNFSLEKCLSHYEKNKLVDVANKQHMILNMGEPIKEEKLIKKEVVHALITQISMNFQEDIFYLPWRELEFLTQIISVDFKVDDHINYMDCCFLHGLGYLYLYNFKEQVYPVIPKELRKLYKQIPKEELHDRTKQSKRLYSYAIALTRLYGIYTVEQFVEVWNSHNEDAISFEDASFYFDMMWGRQDYFIYDYEYVVASHFQGDEGYRLLDENKDKPFRRPTKAEIELYFREDRDLIYASKLAKPI